jgi:hypothetical protein
LSSTCRDLCFEGGEANIVVVSIHARRHTAVQIVFADEKVGDEARGVIRPKPYNEEVLLRFSGDKGSVACSLVLERLHHRLVLALDVELTVSYAAPDGPENSNSLKEVSVPRSVCRVVHENQNA